MKYIKNIQEIAHEIVVKNYSVKRDKQDRYNPKYIAPLEKAATSLLLQYRSGGISGANSWETSNPQPYTIHKTKRRDAYLEGEIETFIDPEIVSFDNDLYEKLINDTLENGTSIESYIENEKYGNRTTLEIVAIDIQQFAQCFKISEQREYFLKEFNHYIQEKLNEEKIKILNNKQKQLKSEKEKQLLFIENHETEMNNLQYQRLQRKKELEKELAKLNKDIENKEINDIKNLELANKKLVEINEGIENIESSLQRLKQEK